MTTIMIGKALATVTENEILTSGMINAKIKFEFSDDWYPALSKTAIFTAGDVTKVVLDSYWENNVCSIPQECLAKNDEILMVGIYGADNANVVAIPTVWATVGKIRKGYEGYEDVSTGTLPIWAQVQSAAAQSATAAKNAQDAVEAAQGKAEDAQAAAEAAQSKAETAQGKAESAQSAAESAAASASGSASAAAASETASAQSSQTAGEKASAAQAAAQTAQSAKADAESAKSAAAGSAQSAGASAQSAQASGKLSESWAVGGTGTRTGEDTNNARYWSEKAQNAAGGGVSSFNGRSGAVTPQIGDYTAEMVGADAQGAAQTVQGNLNTHAENTVKHITAEERTTWDAKSDFSGSYNDLTDKPTIPTVTKESVTNALGYVPADVNDVFTYTENPTFTNLFDTVEIEYGKLINITDKTIEDTTANLATTGFIPVNANSIIRVNDDFLIANSGTSAFMLYDANKNAVQALRTSSIIVGAYYVELVEANADGYITAFKIKNPFSTAFIRITNDSRLIGENPVLTVDEEITYEMGYGEKLNSKVKVDFSQVTNAPQKNCWSILPYERLNIAYSSIGRKPINTVEHFTDAATNFGYNALKCDVQPTSKNQVILSGNDFVMAHYADDGFFAIWIPLNATIAAASGVAGMVYQGNRAVLTTKSTCYGGFFRSTGETANPGYMIATAKISGTGYNVSLRANSSGNINLYVASAYTVPAGDYLLVLGLAE